MDAGRTAADVPIVENRDYDDVVDARRQKRLPGATDKPREHAKPGIVVSRRHDTRVHADGRSSERLGHLRAAARRRQQTAGILADQVFRGLAEVLAERKMAGVLLK